VTVVWVMLGAVVGAPLRYLTDRFVQGRHRSSFPWGTVTVNLAGSFLLGLLAAGVGRGAVSAPAMALLGTGFCGAFTTYSTFGYETVRLISARKRFYAAANVVGSITVGLGAVYCGMTVAAALWA
jgi:fluoride exporter